MCRTISIGAQSFEFIRKNDCFFIDKSDLIREWWESQDAVTLITSISDFKYLYDSTAASGFFTFFFLCGGVGARLP